MTEYLEEQSGRSGPSTSAPVGTALLVYGANGYSGRLIVEALRKRKLEPCLAGRNEAELAAMGRALGLQHRAFDLTDPGAVRAGLRGAKVVLHCAGPFSATSRPMLDACIAQRVHYLDITGEYPVIEATAARNAELRTAGVMAMCGVGLDVVPSDCLAAHVKRRMPQATRLELCVRGLERLSRGTALTFVEGMGKPNVVREDGRLVEKPAGADRRTVELGGKRVTMVGLPWGDIATAWRTTGIPDIRVYMSLMPGAPQMIRLARPLRGLLQSPGTQRFLKKLVGRLVTGPDAAYRDRETTEFLAIATDDEGHECRSLLRTGEGYAFTAVSAAEIAARVLGGGAAPGFQTPGGLFGPDFVLGLCGSSREDLR